jgi:hypothetical protein
MFDVQGRSLLVWWSSVRVAQFGGVSLASSRFVVSALFLLFVEVVDVCVERSALYLSVLGLMFGGFLLWVAVVLLDSTDSRWTVAVHSIFVSGAFLLWSSSVWSAAALASGAGTLVAVVAFGVSLRLWAAARVVVALDPGADLLVSMAVDLQVVVGAFVDLR